MFLVFFGTVLENRPCTAQAQGLGGTCFYLSNGTAVSGRLKGFAVLVNVIVPCY